MNVLHHIRDLLPEATERLAQAARHPSLDFHSDDVRAFIKKIILIRKQVRSRTRVHASAHYRSRTIKFNEYYLQGLLDTLPAEDARLRMLDLLMHEIAHLLTWEFQKYAGHGHPWKLWGYHAGFVTLGSTSEQKRHHGILLIANAREGRGKKTPSLGTKREAKNPASLTRELIKEGLSNQEIWPILQASFPDYKAWKIAPSVYRRQMKEGV